MGYAVERQAVESYFAANWLTTPVAFENVDFTPPAAAPWVCIYVDGGGAAQVANGINNLIRHDGEIIVDIKTPLGIGAATGLGMMDSIVDLFAERFIDPIRCRTPSTYSNGEVGRVPYRSYTIVVPFYRDQYRPMS